MFQVQMVAEKATKNTVRYMELGSNNRIGYLYIQKSALGMAQSDGIEKATYKIKVSAEEVE